MEIKVSLFSLSLSLALAMAYMQRCSSTGSKYCVCVVRLLELYSIRCVPNFPQNRPNVLTVWQDVRNPVK